MIRILSVALLALTVSSWASKLFAGDYQVEIIVFKHMNEYATHDNRNYTPPTEVPSFAGHWEAGEYKLEEQLKQIEESENYQVLLHHAWQQESLPYSESAAVEFKLDPEIHNQFARPISEQELAEQQQEQEIIKQAIPNNLSNPETTEDSEEINNQPLINQALNGWIKIYAKTLLFAQLDLDYFGYRLQEKRRMLLDDVHFFDHPKFGILLQVTRVEETEEEAAETNTTETSAN